MEGSKNMILIARRNNFHDGVAFQTDGPSHTQVHPSMNGVEMKKGKKNEFSFHVAIIELSCCSTSQESTV